MVDISNFELNEKTFQTTFDSYSATYYYRIISIINELIYIQDNFFSYVKFTNC